MATRGSDPLLDLLKVSPGQTDLSITGSKLPTYKQVLLCLLAKIQQLRLNDSTKNTKLLNTVAAYVESDISSHYRKGHIQTILHKNMIKKIVNFHEEFRKVQKFPSDRRENSSVVINFR